MITIQRTITPWKAITNLKWPNRYKIFCTFWCGSVLLFAWIQQELVQQECQRWASKGVNIKYEIRGNRNGYKAGALKEGMKHSYVKMCDYVVIFDADFQPEPDFLWRAIPFLVHNPEIALVQARWTFGNLCLGFVDSCFLVESIMLIDSYDILYHTC